MKQGAAAALVFTGVLALAGGVGFVLYEAGTNVEGDGGVADAQKPSKKKGGRTEVRMVDPDKVGPQRAKPPSTADVRFEIPGHDDLKLRNWREVAKAFNDMQELARELRVSGAPDPSKPEDEERMKRMNAVTDRYRIYVIEPPEGYDVVQPPADPNLLVQPKPAATPVDHPAFVVNLIATILDRENAPLTEEQSKRLLEVARKHSEIRDRPDPPIPENAFKLEILLARGQRADAFYADVFEILSTKQAEIVSPAETRGRAGADPIGAGVVWAGVLRPMPFSDIDKLVDEITDVFAASFNMSDRAKDLRPIVDKWAHRITIDSGDPAELAGAVRATRGQQAVRDMLDLLHHVAEDLDPPPPDMVRVRMVPIALVPLRR
jgi:hypothetical protein